MATLTLRNVPADLLSCLKEEARQNRRSLNNEALTRLEASVGRPRRSGEETVAMLRRLHEKLEGMPLISDEFLRRAKDEGRP